MKACAQAYDSCKCSNNVSMLDHSRWPHGIELVQPIGSAELDRCETLRVMAELRMMILGLLLIEEIYESPYVVSLLEGHTYFHEIQLYRDAAATLAVDKAIW